MLNQIITDTLVCMNIVNQTRHQFRSWHMDEIIPGQGARARIKINRACKALLQCNKLKI